MATTYCTVGDISDYLRVPITSNTTPNKAQVEKIINRKEDEFDRRVGHAWRSKKITREVHDLPLLYTYGWGTPIFLKHRHIYEFDADQGDKIEVWSGAGAVWDNVLGQSHWYDAEYERGKLFLRGYIFSILRKNRVRVTYRYGGESFAGDTEIPLDITDAIIKMTCTEIMNTSFRMDELPTGGMTNTSETKQKWEDDIDRCIENRREIFTVV